MKEQLLKEYQEKKQAIQARLLHFKSLTQEQYFNEFLFCLFTPQSNAQKAWLAVNELSSLNAPSIPKIAQILKSKTRFHNNKAKYAFQAYQNWGKILPSLSNSDIPKLRNWLAEHVKGYGLKEAGHFLRNIGKSNNQIAILDRHILRNLKGLNVINKDSIKNKSDYLDIEQAFLSFSREIGIPIDELDLLFWSRENGEIFK